MTGDEVVAAQLFGQEIPEIADGTVEIKAIARKAGVRTKVALRSCVAGVDAVGVCADVRSSSIREIVDQLGGERIDLILWNDRLETMIENALQPMTVLKVTLHAAQHRATVRVHADPVSLDFSLRNCHRELASRLCGWEIEIEE
jgi:N utilization substance protein A